MSIIKHIFDPNKLPEWTEAEQERFDAIREEDIDYSDIPELDGKFFKRATRASMILRVAMEHQNPS